MTLFKLKVQYACYSSKQLFKEWDRVLWCTQSLYMVNRLNKRSCSKTWYRRCNLIQYLYTFAIMKRSSSSSDESLSGTPKKSRKFDKKINYNFYNKICQKLGEIFEDKNARYIEDHGISRHGISRNYCNLY